MIYEDTGHWKNFPFYYNLGGKPLELFKKRKITIRIFHEYHLYHGLEISL